MDTAPFLSASTSNASGHTGTASGVRRIGDRIRERREARRLTQQDLASALQISAQAVSKWERGENAPDIATLVALSRLLGVSTDWLLGANRESQELFEASVLVSDIAGFYARMERMGVHNAMAWLNGRHYQITEAVLRHDGVPVKYVGDSLISFFAGVEHRDRALRAALLAREMVAEPVRIGLGTGQVYYGTVGHPDYADRALEGEGVFLAWQAETWSKRNTQSLVAASASLVSGLSDLHAFPVGEGQQAAFDDGRVSTMIHEIGLAPAMPKHPVGATA